jgi:hypothetical protein
MQIAADKYSLSFEDIMLIGDAEINHSKIHMRHCEPMCSDVYMRLGKLFVPGKPVQVTLAKDGKVIEQSLASLWSMRGRRMYSFWKHDEATLVLIPD